MVQPKPLTIFVPSRERPYAVNRYMEAWRAASDDLLSEVVWIIDHDDREIDRYKTDLDKWQVRYLVAPRTPRGMVGCLNWAVNETELGFAVGFQGDDHRVRTVGWDSRYLDALEVLGTGFVYGNDLYQRHVMPTQVAMTTNIVRQLGWMAPPELHHLCVDLAWLDLGREIGKITYLDDVIVEHMHPLAGKAPNDRAYMAVNNKQIAGHDASAYDEFKRKQLPNYVQSLLALTSGQ